MHCGQRTIRFRRAPCGRSVFFGGGWVPSRMDGQRRRFQHCVLCRDFPGYLLHQPVPFRLTTQLGPELPDRLRIPRTLAMEARSLPKSGNRAGRKASREQDRDRRLCAVVRSACFRRSICLASARRGSLQIDWNTTATSGSLRAATMNDRNIRPPRPERRRAKFRNCCARSSRNDPESCKGSSGPKASRKASITTAALLGHQR